MQRYHLLPFKIKCGFVRQPSLPNFETTSSWHWETVHSSSFSPLSLSLLLSLPPTHCMRTACQACHTLTLTCSAWLLIWLACEIGHDAPMIWSDKLAIQKTGRGRRRHPKSQTVEAHFLRAILIWSSPLSLFQLQLLPSDSLQRKKLSDKDRGEDRGWKRQIRGWRDRICILSTGHRSSVVYRNCEGNRLIIYPHNLSSGVAPKHSIKTTSAQAAVKHFSQQALKMLYLSIWNAHPSRSSSLLSIRSY